MLTPEPVLGLNLRRLSQDIQVVLGYPVFLAETFVDVSCFAGTCYRASNWRSLELTRGFSREPGGHARWRHHGQSKEIFVFELIENAAERNSPNLFDANTVRLYLSSFAHVLYNRFRQGLAKPVVRT